MEKRGTNSVRIALSLNYMYRVKKVKIRPKKKNAENWGLINTNKSKIFESQYETTILYNPWMNELKMVKCTNHTLLQYNTYSNIPGQYTTKDST